jgi:6-phosphogluconolactonase
MSLQLQCFDSSTAAAVALAGAVAADLNRALQQQNHALLVVSGGRSPLPFFSALSQQPLAWHNVAISLVDERCVPITHDDSNSALVRRHLLINAAASAQWIALAPPDLSGSDPDPWCCAVRAAEAANGNPVLATPSVIVLGIGTDGHTASLFADAPQWLQARTTERRYLAVKPASAPHSRISLSLSALIAQGSCQVWAVGPDKLATIERCGKLPADACALAALIADTRVRLQVYYSPS